MFWAGEEAGSASRFSFRFGLWLEADLGMEFKVITEEWKNSRVCLMGDLSERAALIRFGAHWKQSRTWSIPSMG